VELDRYKLSPPLRQKIQALPKFELTGLFGFCPVQAEGFLDDQFWYFRARGDVWRFEVGGDAEFTRRPVWWFGEHWPSPDGIAAGWMTDEEALGCIYRAAEDYYTSDRGRFQESHPDYERTVFEGWSFLALTLADVAEMLGIDPEQAGDRAQALGFESPWTFKNELKWIIADRDRTDPLS
jgi:hypothetical protein